MEDLMNTELLENVLIFTAAMAMLLMAFITAEEV